MPKNKISGHASRLVVTALSLIRLFNRISDVNLRFWLQLTWADLHYAAQSETLSSMLQHDLNKDHPELKKLVEKVRSLPNIKSYLDSRPKTVI